VSTPRREELDHDQLLAVDVAAHMCRREQKDNKCLEVNLLLNPELQQYNIRRREGAGPSRLRAFLGPGVGLFRRSLFLVGRPSVGLV
jgi:hypothetical protein